MEFLAIAGIDIGLAITKAVIALLVVWLTLRTFDKVAGTSFKNDYYPQLMEGNMAVAMYCGLRFLGAALLGGLTFIIPL